MFISPFPLSTYVMDLHMSIKSLAWAIYTKWLNSLSIILSGDKCAIQYDICINAINLCLMDSIITFISYVFETFSENILRDWFRIKTEEESKLIFYM